MSGHISTSYHHCAERRKDYGSLPPQTMMADTLCGEQIENQSLTHPLGQKFQEEQQKHRQALLHRENPHRQTLGEKRWNELPSEMGIRRRRIQNAGNECLFVPPSSSQSSASWASSPSFSSSSSSKSLLLAFLLVFVTFVSFTTANEAHQQQPFSLESDIDPEAAALLESVHQEASYIPEETPSQFHVIEDSESDCVKITFEEGIFHYKSRGGSQTCGLYLISDPSKVISITIEYLDAQCDEGGLISVVDGWELNGAVFPSYEDHEKSPSNRFQDLCANSKKQILPVRRIYTSSQNAALIQYRIPMFGQGFSVRVEHVHNPRPCNILVQDIEGIFTLENYGRNVNCSLMTIFDSKIRLMYLSTGLHHRSSVKTFSHGPRLQKGIYHKCGKMGMEDFVQIGGSSSLDTTKAEVLDELCGYQPHPSSKAMTIFCGMTTIRLVSSGKYANKVVAEVMRATIDDLDSANYICDLGLGY